MRDPDVRDGLRARKPAQGENEEPFAGKGDTADLLTPWQKVAMARHGARPYTLDYIRRLCTDFVELHGDRRFGDDSAIVSGPAFLHGRAVMIVGQQKGLDTRENVRRNFAMAHPEGYRKAQRMFLQAESLALPVLTLIDTPGAAVGVADEERGQAEAIAGCIRVPARLRVLVISVIIGEGNSGGAMALGVADRLLMMEHAYFSVAAPEAAAAILYCSAVHAPKAAEALGITADDLFARGLIDGIIREPPGGSQCDHGAAAAALGERVVAELDRLLPVPVDLLLARRYAKYRGLC
jgi:acetyl-CoA carboxylase carboxyl transferase subunit alpha